MTTEKGVMWPADWLLIRSGQRNRENPASDHRDGGDVARSQGTRKAVRS